MKKGTSKILSALLIATLVFTSAGVAFADSGESVKVENSKIEKVAAESVKASVPSEIKKGTTKKQLKTTSEDAGSFPITNIITGNETVPGYYINPIDQVFSVSVPAKGTVMIGMESNLSQGSVYFKLYSDAACTNLLGIASVSTSALEKTLVADVPSAGTYYLEVLAYSAAGTVNVWGSFAYGTDTTLSNKTWRVVGGKEARTNYLKFKAPNTGTVKINSQNLSGYVTLLNSSKKAISEENSFSSNYPTVTYGVKKGVTYYLKVAARGNYDDGAYRIKYTSTKVTDLNLSKKSKAKTLKRKAKATSTVFVASTSKDTDWYKFKVPKKQVTQIKVSTSGINSGILYVTAYKGSKKIGKTQTISAGSAGAIYTLTYGTYGKANAGTYYIKIQQGAKASGKYSIKYVK